MAALKVAGNSLEEIEALEIAGNTIVQDADSVSNSLKVLSMRLRGTTGSALEEIGEDTEGLIEDFSKLNNKIQSLTKTANDPKGVSIVDKMTGGYKSTYKILLEISKVWKDIGDMQKAELLEIMAGKVRATAAAAILESPELLERAFQDASENAVGAGARAIDASLSSIEKKTNKIKNNLQHFSQTLFDSEGVKNLLDAVVEFTASLDAEKFQPIVHTLETLLSILSKLLEIIPAEGVIGAIIGAKYIKNLSGLQGFIGRIFGSAVPAINQVTDATATLGTTTTATTAAVEAEGVAMQATTVKAVALKAAVGAIAAVLITSVISAINNLIHRQEQLNKEFADSMRTMQKNTNAYEQEAKRIDQLVAKYNEYNTAIENNTLSGSALIEAQNSMRDVQKELNDAFNDGASKLDLINKKYQENSDIIKENVKLSREKFLADNASTYQKAKAQQNDSWLKEVLGGAGYLTLGEWQTAGKFTVDDRDKEEAERRLDADRIVKGLLKEYNFDIFNGDIDTFRASISSLIADYMSEKIDIDSFADKYGTTQEYVTNVIQQIMQDWSAALEDENSQTNSAILGKDVVKQYDKYLLANDPEYYALYTELEGLVDGYQKAVSEQNREQIAEFGDKIYDFVVKTGPFNELPIEYGKFFSELFAKYTGTVVQFGPKEEQEALNEFLKYSDWLNAESNVKNGDKAYSNNALINAYKSSLDQLKDYIENDEEGKVEVNFGEIIRTTASDELFKSLGMDGFEEYIKKYGQEYTAIFAYINDAEKSLINNLDMNTQDKNILLTTLHDIKLEALGGADNVHKLRDSYKELKGETESDISRSMTKLTAGEKLTYQEMTKIINKYPDLRSAVIKYSDDSYSIQKENIDNLITEYAGLSNAAVSEMQEMYEATIHVAWAQIGLYRSVAETKKIYHDALETRGPLNNLFGENTGKVIEAIKFLEELEGSWLPEDNDGDKGGNKDSKAQYDWLDSYLDKRNRALQKEETAYDRLTNKVIKKGDIESKYTQLQNQSLEEQNKLLDDQIAAYSEAEKEYGRRMKKGLLYNDLVEAFGGSKDKANEIVQKIINREDINLLEYTSEQSSAISAMADNYNKQLDAADKKLEAQNTKRENALKMFTNNIEFITKKFDHVLNEFAQRQSQLEHYQSMRTNSGMMENQKLYVALLDNESRELAANIAKRNELINTLNTMKPKTEAEIEKWWETKDAIDSTTQAIWESQEAIESYNASMQQLSWDLNDKIRDITGNIRNETAFLMDTLGTFEKDMYSYERQFLGNDAEKTKIYNGQMSEQGLATLALRRVNAKSLREDVERINKEIEDAQELYLQNTANTRNLDRLNDLISERNNLIQSYKDEREAIVSLVKEGYDKQLESLQAITDKYMEARQAEKDLYDYQKNIAKQTKNIANLRKQISAYAGDMSEEARAKMQTLTVQLEEAEEGLADTQYERQLSDQQRIFDHLYQSLEDYFNDKLENPEKIISDTKDLVNNNIPAIKQTLAESLKHYKTNISASLNNILGESGIGKVASNIAAVDGDIKAIKNSVTERGDDLKKYLKQNELTLAKKETIYERINALGLTQEATLSKRFDDFNTKLTEINNTIKSIDKTNTTPTSTSMTVDAFFELMKDEYNLGKKTRAQLVKLLNKGEFDDYIAKHNISLHYASGTKRVGADALAWTQERGFEAILRPTDNAILTPLKAGDSVLNAKATQTLWDFANNPLAFMRQNMGVTNVSRNSGVTFNNSMSPTIVVNGVSNANEFIRELQKNKQFESMIQDMTINQMNGGNPLAKMKYKF